MQRNSTTPSCNACESGASCDRRSASAASGCTSGAVKARSQRASATTEHGGSFEGMRTRSSATKARVSVIATHGGGFEGARGPCTCTRESSLWAGLSMPGREFWLRSRRRWGPPASRWLGEPQGGLGAPQPGEAMGRLGRRLMKRSSFPWAAARTPSSSATCIHIGCSSCCAPSRLWALARPSGVDGRLPCDDKRWLRLLGTPTTFAIFSSMLMNCVLMNFRRSTMSFTVAVFDPRKESTTSIKSPKLNCTSSMPSSDSKMKSARSTNPHTSTSTLLRSCTAASLSMIALNSLLEIMWSPSSSRPPCSRIARNPSLTVPTVICSFSTAATALTTSHSTPISMFMTVSAARSTKM
mmetsp:Transcript_26620/g.84454  ORF Transcript_26620/g.84454 Transcript_26620/m.84454 type:complete len:354 (+) Transcript_26620:346-1407(+)